MTERKPQTGSAFESLHQEYAVHVPRFEAFVGPPLEPSTNDRTNERLRSLDQAIEAEQQRLRDAVQQDERASGTPTYVPLAGPLPGATDGSSQRTNDVRSITFTESVGSDGELAKVELEVHNVYDPTSQRYRYSDPPKGEDSPLLDYGRTLALRLGYRDDLTFVFDGVITAYRISFPAEGASMISVTAVDRRDALRSFTPPRPPAARYDTEEEALKDLVGQAGFYLARRSESQATPPAGRVRLPRDGDVGSYVRERALRVALELSCLGETIFALSPGDVAAEALVYRYRSGLISFTPSFDANGQRTRVIVRARTPRGASLVGRASLEELQVDGLTPTDGESALVTVENRSVREREVTVTDVYAESQAEANQLALALLKRNLDRLFTAEGELIGDPRVRAGTSLRIEGVGRFDGVYYVTRAIHEYGEGGYRTRFTARRNTRPRVRQDGEGEAT